MSKNNEQDDDLAGWGSELDGKKAATVGVNAELLRKAIKLNPNMKGGKNTEDIIQQLEDAASHKSNAPVARPGASSVAMQDLPKDLVKAIVKLREDFTLKRKKLRDDILALQKEEKTLPNAVMNRVVDVILALDPNMTSVQTTEILRMEAAFLKEVQFEPRKVIERKLGKS
jgi:hypothetical protein